jgi:hypothetical protein
MALMISKHVSYIISKQLMTVQNLYIVMYFNKTELTYCLRHVQIVLTNEESFNYNVSQHVIRWKNVGAGTKCYHLWHYLIIQRTKKILIVVDWVCG